MATFLHHLLLAAPLFALVFVGLALMRVSGWPPAVAQRLTQFVFVIAIPAMLFRMMADLSKLPPVDVRLLLAFFGGALLVFAVGRVVAWKCFALDGRAQSVFAMGGIFSNNVFLGLPMARLTIGDAAMPAVALVLVFNALILWTLVTVSIEWASHGRLALKAMLRTLGAVITNPVVASILAGTAFGMAGLSLPGVVEAPLAFLGQAASPMALIALGMGLSEYGVGMGWRISAAISAIKLVLQPLVVWLLARLLGLPQMETQVVVLLASIAVGTNVFLMARHFKVLEGPVAGSLLLSTLLAAASTPLVLTLLHLG